MLKHQGGGNNSTFSLDAHQARVSNHLLGWSYHYLPQKIRHSVPFRCLSLLWCVNQWQSSCSFSAKEWTHRGQDRTSVFLPTFSSYLLELPFCLWLVFYLLKSNRSFYGSMIFGLHILSPLPWGRVDQWVLSPHIYRALARELLFIPRALNSPLRWLIRSSICPVHFSGFKDTVLRGIRCIDTD